MRPIERVLATIDHSAVSEEILKASYSLAKKFKSKLWVLNVVPQSPFDGTFFSPLSEQALAQMEAQAQKKIQETLSSFNDEGLEVHKEVKLGAPYVEILKLAKKNKISLIIAGSHGRKGWKNLFLGSVAETLIRRAECPVWILKAPFSPPKKILVPIDLSEPSRASLPWALLLAKAYGAALHLLCVFEPIILPDYMQVDYTEFELKMKENKKEEFSKLVQELSGSAIPVTGEFLEGDPRFKIEEIQKLQNCDLILLSTQGKSFIACKLLGSVAAHVVRDVSCSTITVRPDGFKLKDI
ncbi:MAG: universal stress protein [Deltaproteobacteria bacterium]|nr:universal stress protein [Deltaproteobacteria bacterium]